MRAILASFLLAAVIVPIAQAAEKSSEMRFEAARIVPEGIIAYVYKKVPIGGSLGGSVGYDWQLGTETALVTQYAKQGDIAEGEKFTVRTVKEGVQKVNDGITERTLRVYRAVQ